MRLPGAALLIVIGLLLLWLATSGNLDRLGIAWDYIVSDATLPGSSSAGGGGSGFANDASGVVDSAAYQAGTLLHGLQPTVGVVQPGGMN